MKCFKKCFSKKIDTTIERSESSILPDPVPDYSVQEIQHITSINDTVKFIPPIKYGKVIQVCDESTFIIATKLPYPESPIYRFYIKLRGIYCFDLLSVLNEQQIIQSQKQYQILSDTILGKIVSFTDIEIDYEKRGVLFAYVFLNDICVNTHILLSSHVEKQNNTLGQL